MKLGILLAVNLTAYFLIGRLFYKTWNEVGEALGCLIFPGQYSSMRGVYTGSLKTALKAYLYLGLCALVTVAEFYFLCR